MGFKHSLGIWPVQRIITLENGVWKGPIGRVNVQKNQLFPYKVYRIETWHGYRSCKTTFQNFFFNKKFQGFQPFQARLTANF